MSFQNVFFDTKELSVVDVVMPNGLGKYTGKSLIETAASRSSVVEISWKSAEARIEAKATKGPVEITEKKWWGALEVLPPMAWCNRGFSESFRVSEAITYQVYWAYVRLGKRYFELAQPASVTHDQLVALVEAEFGAEA